MENKLPFENANRQIIVKKNAKTSESYGKDPYLRSVEELIDYGIINVNKPKGPTSHQTSAYLQEILGINKSGHSGTLDPNVTGVLPIATARATRIVQGLLIAGKEYVGIMHMHKNLSDAELKKGIDAFKGRIKQLPPIKSNVKRAWRFRTIYYFEVLDREEKEVLFKVGCQAGTYIRKLIHDFGQKMNIGANMTQLIRTKAGPFKIDDSFTLHDVADALHIYKTENNDKFIRKVVRPIEEAVSHLPKVWVLDSTVDSICHGSALAMPGIAKLNSRIEKEEIVAVMTLKDELVALGDASMTTKEMVANEKGIAVRITKVFMLPGTYPKIA